MRVPGERPGSLAAAEPTDVSAWTRLPTRRACWNSALRVVPTTPAPWAAVRAARTWPRIWVSPSTIESSPLATLKVCATAPSSK